MNGALRASELVRRYDCGPIPFVGTENAFYKRPLLFDSVIDPEVATAPHAADKAGIDWINLIEENRMPDWAVGVGTPGGVLPRLNGDYAVTRRRLMPPI